MDWLDAKDKSVLEFRIKTNNLTNNNQNQLNLIPLVRQNTSNSDNQMTQSPYQLPSPFENGNSSIANSEEFVPSAIQTESKDSEVEIFESLEKDGCRRRHPERSVKQAMELVYRWREVSKDQNISLKIAAERM
mmetsp:Transcript_36640/g.32846  ORF Transcript_36640/g.32846 Transcript_36640/m.32846 type:complete len:133 (-) Transcript_36640:256-654(-)